MSSIITNRGDVFTNLFDIEVDTGDFTKVVHASDVTDIYFNEVREGALRITLVLKDKRRLSLALASPWDQVDDKDGIVGTEKAQGEIKIPFTKIETIHIQDPNAVQRGASTKATLVPAGSN